MFIDIRTVHARRYTLVNTYIIIMYMYLQIIMMLVDLYCYVRIKDLRS